MGPSASVYNHPAHPYTQGLLDAVPAATVAVAAADKITRSLTVRGELPSAVNPPSGCRFRTRCPRAQTLCAEVEPLLTNFGTDHVAACHFPLQTPVTITNGSSAALPARA
jgi:oligopeptide/dipeptide ABC transporter ATP-binding protein